MNEAAWQQQVVDLARLTRWLVHHTRPARRADGTWSTPIQGDPGFPDLVMIRGSRVLWVELKSDTGRLTTDQMAWRDRLLLAGQEWYCWRPRDWPKVQKTLRPADHSNLRLTDDIGTGGLL
jgi:hypothetical protein